jgi:lauroyl/myristoyl acyltransferase
MRWIFDRYYHMKPKRVGIMHANIGRAFPEFSETEIEAFGKKVYIETAKTAGELLLIYHDRLDIDAMILNREEVIERLRSLQAEAPHGIIYIMHTMETGSYWGILWQKMVFLLWE